MGRLWLCLGIALVVAMGISPGMARPVQEEKRAETSKKKVKPRVYTMEDLKRLRKGSGRVSTIGVLSRREGVQEEAKPGEESPREALQRSLIDRYKEAKRAVVALKERRTRLQNELNQLTTGVMGSVFPDQTQALLNEIARKREELRKLDQEIFKKEKEIQGIRREARRRGVSPGVFRQADREIARTETEKPET